MLGLIMKRVFLKISLILTILVLALLLILMVGSSIGGCYNYAKIEKIATKLDCVQVSGHNCIKTIIVTNNCPNDLVFEYSDRTKTAYLLKNCVISSSETERIIPLDYDRSIDEIDNLTRLTNSCFFEEKNNAFKLKGSYTEEPAYKNEPILIEGKTGEFNLLNNSTTQFLIGICFFALIILAILDIVLSIVFLIKKK